VDLGSVKGNQTLLKKTPFFEFNRSKRLQGAKPVGRKQFVHTEIPKEKGHKETLVKTSSGGPTQRGRISQAVSMWDAARFFSEAAEEKRNRQARGKRLQVLSIN